MNLETIRLGLGTWFSSKTGLVARYKTDSQQYGGTFNPSYSGAPANAFGILYCKVVGSVGRDGRKWDYYAIDGGDSFIQPVTYGARTIRWEIQVHSLEHTEANSDAAYYLNLIRDNLHSYSASKTFKDLEIGVNTTFDVNPIPTVEGFRSVSVAQMDVLFNAYSEVEDDAISYVDTIVLSTQWRDSAGNLLDSEFQFSGEIP